MRVSYHPGYCIALPEGHRFPMRKFPALCDRLLREGLVAPADILEPEPATLEDLRLVHTSEYLDALANQALDRSAERRLGLPCTPELWRRSRLSVGGSLAAVRAALEDGIAANLAGGTHHAFADRGEGFCVLNDVAVAIRRLRTDGAVRRVLVADLDVHQGNGTAEIFADDDETYTFSIHGERNYPFHKSRSNRDVPLEDGEGDTGYLLALEAHLPEAMREASPDLVCYLAGVDPVRGDRFGRLDLSPEGLARRDRSVLECAREAGVPIAVFTAGGYAATAEATADLHATVHREARHVFGPRTSDAACYRSEREAERP